MSGKLVVYVNEDSNFSLAGRLRAPDGALATQAKVSSLSWKVFDLDDRANAFQSGSLTVADVIYDSLQTDDSWDEDSTGYNFRHDISSAIFTDPERRYMVEYTVSWASGGQSVLRSFEVRVSEVWSS